MKKKDNHTKEKIIAGLAVGAAAIGATAALLNPSIRKNLKNAAGKAVDGVREFTDNPQAVIDQVRADLAAFIDGLELEKLDAKFRDEIEKRRGGIEKQITEFTENEGQEIVAQARKSFEDLRKYVEKHS